MDSSMVDEIRHYFQTFVLKWAYFKQLQESLNYDDKLIDD